MLDKYLTEDEKKENARESAIFKAIPRAQLEKIAENVRKGIVDVKYEPKMSQVRKKPLCLVKIDDKKTERRKRNFELDLCSKGTKECRHSNSRLAT